MNKKHKDLEKIRRRLVEKFTSSYFLNLEAMDEYVIGRSKESFCYIVEVELKELGEIRGSNSSKFGLWYGKYGKSSKKDYRATKKHFDGDVKFAFEQIKKELAKLIDKTSELKEFKDINCKLSNMFKYKIMYLYNSKIMLPIYVKKDLNLFERHLSLKESQTFEQSQKQLMKYRDKCFPTFDNFTFMDYLYKKYKTGRK